MMRLAIIAASLYGELDRHGGGPLSDAVLALRDRGHDVTVFSQHPGQEVIDTELAGLPARLIPADRRHPRWYVADKVAKWFYGERKLFTDACELNRFWERYAPFDAAWALSELPDSLTAQIAWENKARFVDTSPPLLTTVQAVRWATARPARHGEPERIKRTRPTAMKWALTAPEIVAANSHLAARWLERDYGIAQVKLASYPVNFSRRFLDVLPEPLIECAADAPIVFFGALNPTKAPDLFLEAAIELVQRGNSDRRFVVIGGRTEKNPRFDQKLETLRQHPTLKDRVEWTGRLPMEEVLPSLRGAAVVVLPSRSDTFSRATIEALAVGTPVVVSTEVGAKEIVEREACGLIAPLEAGGLAQAIEQALDQRNALAEKARALRPWLREHHSPAAAAARIESLLEACLG
ncbi:MAG: glycosyltransferase family 4 protein [Verrucomicrobiota bacterium]